MTRLACAALLCLLFQACGGPKDQGDLNPVGGVESVLRGELLVETDGSRTAPEIEADLRRLKIGFENIFERFVFPLVAGSYAEQPDQGLHPCLELVSRSFKIKTFGLITQAELAGSFFYVTHVEPHFVFESLESPEKLYSRIRGHLRGKRYTEVIQESTQYLSQFSEKRASLTYRVRKFRLEAFYELAKYSDVVREGEALVRSSSLKLQQRIEIYEWILKALHSDGQKERLREVEDLILSDTKLKNTRVGKKIRAKRFKEEKGLTDELLLNRVREEIAHWMNEGEPVKAALLAYRELKDRDLALALLEPHWKTLNPSERKEGQELRTTIYYLSKILKEKAQYRRLNDIYLKLFEKVTPKNFSDYEKVLSEAIRIARKEKFLERAQYEELMIVHFPKNAIAVRILEAKRKERERKEKKERERIHSIRTLSDPLNEYLWAFHSGIVVNRKSRPDRGYEIRRLAEGERPTKRFDVYLKEAIQKISQFHDVLVAVVDSGIDYNHPDLKDVVAVNSGEVGPWTDAPEGSECKRLECNQIDDDQNGFVDDWRGYDFVDRDNSPKDYSGHGTHVAGIIAGAFNTVGISGINPSAKILPVRVLNSHGRGSTAQVVAGVAYAVAQGARVINVSLGGPNASRLAREAYSCAVEHGALVVAAAGNKSSDRPHFPSDLPGVLSVASINYEGNKSDFSNYSINVDVSAPGEGILSTWPTYLKEKGEGVFVDKSKPYFTASGTSMAAPMVSGLASLLWSWNPQMKGGEVRARILASAHPFGGRAAREFQWQLGDGVVHAEEALEIKQRPVFRPRKGDRLLMVEMDRHSKSDFNWSLELEDHWKSTGNSNLSVQFDLDQEFNHSSLRLLGQEIDWADHGAIQASLNLSVQELPDSVTDVPLRMGYSWDRNGVRQSSETHSVAVRLDPYHQLYDLGEIKDERPDHRFWLPWFVGWGIWNVQGREGKLWTASISKRRGRVRTDLRLDRMSLGGDSEKGWPRSFRLLSLGPRSISKPVVLDPEYGQDVVISTSFSSRHDRSMEVPMEERLVQGLNLLNESGKVRLHYEDSSHRYRDVVIGNQSIYVLREPSRSKLIRKNIKQIEIARFNSNLEEQGSFSTEVSIHSDVHLMVCRLTGDSNPEVVLVSELPEGDQDRSGRNHVHTRIHVLDDNLQVVEEKTIEGLRTEWAGCGNLSSGENDRLLLNSSTKESRIEMKVQALQLVDGALRVDWSYQHWGYEGPGTLSVVPWKNDRRAVVLNYDYRSFSVLDASTGAVLKGFPVSAPENRFHREFIRTASTFDWDGDGDLELVLTEPSDRVHVFDLTGKLLKTFKRSGNYWSKPLFVSEKNALYLGGHKGLHLLQWESPQP